MRRLPGPPRAGSAGSRRRLFGHLASVGLVAALAFTFLRFGDAAELGRLIATARPGWVLVGGVLFLTGHVLRTLRLRLLLQNPRTSLARLFCWTGLHAVWNYLLPARTGEASLLLYLRYYERESMAHSAAALLLVRLLEVAWLIALVPLVLLPFGDRLSGPWLVASLGGAGVAAAVLAGIAWAVSRSTAEEVDPASNERGLLRRLAAGIRSVLWQARTVAGRSRWWPLVILTVAIWTINLVVFYLGFVVFNVAIPLYIALIVMIGMAAVQLLPVQGFANAGSHELIWVPVLTLAGLGLQDAISLALATHLLYLFYIGVFGATLLLYQHLVIGRSDATSPG